MRTVLLPLLACVALHAGIDGDGSSGKADREYPSALRIAEDVGQASVDEAYLLAFMDQVDERPLQVESALVVIKLEGGKWRLAHVYRHPARRKEGFDWWHLSIVFDAKIDPLREFDHRPTRNDVEDFLKRTTWKFAPSDGFRLRHGKVFTETWEKALGYKPDHRFPDEAR